MKVEITVKYNIGSKPHKEVFKSYSLFGQWYTRNYRGVRIINIDTQGDY